VFKLLEQTEYPRILGCFW